jgi:hypothetical protein
LLWVMVQCQHFTKPNQFERSDRILMGFFHQAVTWRFWLLSYFKGCTWIHRTKIHQMNIHRTKIHQKLIKRTFIERRFIKNISKYIEKEPNLT